jgi:CRP-like cAMP-binding protein
MSQPQSAVRNRLLQSLSAEDYRILEPHLQPFQLEFRTMVAEADTLIEKAFFVESGILSLLAQSPEGRIEVGMAGREGAGGVAAAFGATRHLHAMMCQGKGEALAIPVEDLKRACQQSWSLAALLGKYLHYQNIQIGQTAYGNVSLNIDARLARWILMTDDRSEGFELNLTHEFLSLMLGTGRPGVTSALHVLEGAKMIKAERASITVLDRGKLEYLCSDVYGLAEAEYERLFA